MSDSFIIKSSIHDYEVKIVSSLEENLKRYIEKVTALLSIKK